MEPLAAWHGTFRSVATVVEQKGDTAKVMFCRIPIEFASATLELKLVAFVLAAVALGSPAAAARVA